MNVFTLSRRAPVAYGMAAILLLFMGQFALFTYLRPFLETVTQVDVPMLSLMLLAIGVAGLSDVADRSMLTLGSPSADRSFRLAMAAIAVALIAFGKRDVGDRRPARRRGGWSPRRRQWRGGRG